MSIFCGCGCWTADSALYCGALSSTSLRGLTGCVLPADYEVDFITFFDRLTSLGAKVNADQYLVDQLVDAPRL